MMNLKQEIRDFIVESFLFGQDEGLTDDTGFLDAGIVDSTGIMELVAHLQQKYDVVVKDEELIPNNLDSLNAITAYLEGKLRERRLRTRPA